MANNQRRLSGQWRDGTFDPVLYANVAPRQEDGTELTDAHKSTGSAEPPVKGGGGAE